MDIVTPFHTRIMATESLKCCCLCQNDLNSLKGSRRHKKYNGSSCATERETLGNIVSSFGDQSVLVEKNFEGDATICYDCSSKLIKVKKLEAELTKLKMEIKSLMSSCIQTHESDSCPPCKVIRRDNALLEPDDSPKCEVSTVYVFSYINLYCLPSYALE